MVFYKFCSFQNLGQIWGCFLLMMFYLEFMGVVSISCSLGHSDGTLVNAASMSYCLLCYFFLILSLFSFNCLSRLDRVPIAACSEHVTMKLARLLL